MDTEKIIQDAIKAEVAAHDLYAKASEMVSVPSTKDLLTNLAHEELKHKQMLESMDLNKLGEFDSDATIDVAQNLAMTPLDELNDVQEIMQLAIRREQAEHDNYEHLKSAFTSNDVKALFEKLSVEESKHKALLEKEYALMFD